MTPLITFNLLILLFLFSPYSKLDRRKQLDSSAPIADNNNSSGDSNPAFINIFGDHNA